MTATRRSAVFAMTALALVAASPVPAAAPASKKAAPPASKPAAAQSSPLSLLPGGNSKEPVNIDADKLDYFDKEQKLVYTGNVVAVQGESTLKGSVLTIFLQKQDTAQAGAAPAQPGAGPAATGSSVRHMDVQGPVTLISKDQIGTGDSATYDKADNKVTMTGNVTLTQGTNVTQGDRLVYDLSTSQAQVFSSSAVRVKSVFTPGSQPAGEAPPKPDKAPAPKRKAPAPKAAATAEQ